jgi:hypothetical protein
MSELASAAGGLAADVKTMKKLALNQQRNRAQDQTPTMDAGTAAFRWDDAKDQAWNPEGFSLLWGTPVWDAADARQRRMLNQLYWVAYYSQIVSAEIATIYFNQTSAAGLYGVEDFRVVCDTLDLESAQERAHIHAFRTIAGQTEDALLGRRVFTWPLRGPIAETMVFSDTGPFRAAWKRLQLRTFGLLSSENAFIACQYFLVRGLRTLNGKLVQHRLSQHYLQAEDKEGSPIPSKVSYWHFLDESFHFNSSTVISHDVVRSLRAPTAFERWVVNLGLRGCQRDHRHFSVAINGIFWHDPALYDALWHVLTSPAYGLAPADAQQLLRRTFTEESPGLHASAATHATARDSYKTYLDGLPFVDAVNREQRITAQASVADWLATNRRAFSRWRPPAPLALPLVPLVEGRA